MPSAAAPTLGVGSRRCALLCAALLSCTTVRTPVSRIEPAVLDLQEPAAAPQIELWVESNRPLSPQDEERYRSEARRALEAALAGRAQPQDTLLVVRAQGITRTPGHKGDQAAATAGMVVGAVVIVTLVIVAIVAGGKQSGGSAHVPHGGSSGGGMHVAHAPHLARVPHAGAPVRVAAAPPPRPLPAGPAVPPPRPVPTGPLPVVPGAPRRFPPVPGPGRPFVPGPGPHLPGPYLSPGPNIDVGLWWLFPVDVYPPYEPDLPYPPGEPQEASPTEPPPSYTPPPPPGSPGNGPAGAVASGEVPPLPAEEFQEITVDPPPQLPVEARGFFDGDRLVLEAAVIDRSSGETLRTKSVERKVDPRNAAAVKRAVDELLSTDGWNAPEAPGSQSGNPP